MEQDKRARWLATGEIRWMAQADAYVMARRPGAMPFVIGVRDWLALPLAETGRKYAAEYRAAFTTPNSDQAKDSP